MQTYIQDLHRKYGDVVCFSLGVRTFVWIKDGPLVRRLFASEEFSDRQLTLLPFAKQITGDKAGGKSSENLSQIFSNDWDTQVYTLNVSFRHHFQQKMP